MSFLKGAVYDPPSQDFPFVAIVFAPSGEVEIAVTVPNRAAGDKLIAESIAAASFQTQVK
jgi:hypothetical protein